MSAVSPVNMMSSACHPMFMGHDSTVGSLNRLNSVQTLVSLCNLWKL